LKIKKLDIAVTNLCNHKCKNCFIWETYNDGSLSVKSEVSLSQYQDFFMKHNFWTNLAFTGGEPFLRKDFTDIVKSAIDICPKLKMFSMNTNGYSTKLIVKNVKEILKFSKGKEFHIRISLDGNQEFHDDSRGLKLAYVNALKTFSALKSIANRSMSVGLEYTISSYNEGKLQEFMEENSFSPDDIILTVAQESYRYANPAIAHKEKENSETITTIPIENTGHMLLDQIANSSTESVPEVRPNDDLAKQDVKYFLSRLKPKSVLNVGQWTFLKHYLHDIKIPCVAGKDTFHADPFGDINLCTLIEEKVGNIKTNYLTEREEYITDCNCYTPCESYYGLAANKTKSVFRALAASTT
jgi:MoaA/NifB/PqqE/SkfB family radical SAM enzyme